MNPVNLLNEFTVIRSTPQNRIVHSNSNRCMLNLFHMLGRNIKLLIVFEVQSFVELTITKVLWNTRWRTSSSPDTISQSKLNRIADMLLSVSVVRFIAIIVVESKLTCFERSEGTVCRSSITSFTRSFRVALR